MQEQATTTLELDALVQACGSPVQLFNHLNLESHEPVAIVSDVPIKVGGITIWSATPIYIMHPHYLPIRTAPELGPTFAKGWNSLPTELKCAVLAWGLLEDEPISDPYSFGGRESEIQNLEHHMAYADPSYEKLLLHQHMTPEIATLAARMFYESNSFRLCVTGVRRYYRDQDGNGTLIYPPRDVNCFIKTILVHIKTDACHWHHIRRLAEGYYGFATLKDITIVVENIRSVHPNSAWRAFRQAVGNKILRFVCSGKIEVIEDNVWSDGPEIDSADVLRFLERRVRLGDD